MKTTALFLCTLAIASLALVPPTISGEPQQAAAPADKELMTKFYVAVQAQVLGHLNPKPSLADRFSRTLRPMPSKYFDTQIVKTGKDGVVDFNVMKNDRMDPKAPKRTAFTAGRFNGKTGEVFLFDGTKDTLVPAVEHPSIKKGATS